MTRDGWSTSGPALGELLVRMIALKARLDRVEAARRLQAIERAQRALAG